MSNAVICIIKFTLMIHCDRLSHRSQHCLSFVGNHYEEAARKFDVQKSKMKVMDNINFRMTLWADRFDGEIASFEKVTQKNYDQSSAKMNCSVTSSNSVLLLQIFCCVIYSCPDTLQIFCNASVQQNRFANDEFFGWLRQYRYISPTNFLVYNVVSTEHDEADEEN